MTDPMTPVRALIEAAGKYDAVYNAHHADAIDRSFAWDKYVAQVSRVLPSATASISQLLSEHDKVVALIIHMWDARNAGLPTKHLADKLSAIVEGK